MDDQKVPNDLVAKIISNLPLKLVVQCKVLSKNLNDRISDPKFCQILSERQKISMLLDSCRSDQILHKISINRIAASHCEMTTFPVKFSVLATSKGLILLDFYIFANYCVFNPITGAHQLIQYPDTEECYWRKSDPISDPAFFVHYPASDQYMLATVKTSDESYTFQVFSSIGCGVWREFQLDIIDPDLYLQIIRPVYVHDSFHWLRGDNGGGVIACHTKKMEAIFIDPPELNINYENFMWSKWLGVTHGLLTLVCTLDNSIVISSYDYASNKWSVSHNVNNFIMGLDYYNYSFPVWIHGGKDFFIVDDHDSEINKYEITPALEDGLMYPFRHNFYTFAPSLATVHTMLSHAIHPKFQLSIIAKLDKFKRFIANCSS